MYTIIYYYIIIYKAYNMCVTVDGELEIGELLRNLDVVNYHCYYGKELMREFKRIDKDDDGVIR